MAAERSPTNVIALHPQEPQEPRRDQTEIGHLVGWSREGGFQVELPHGTVSCAGTTVPLDPLALQRAVARRERVLVTVTQSGVSVITGFVHGAPNDEDEDGADPREVLVYVDGDRLVLQGREAIELRCGRASIVLRRSGEIEFRGEEIASRSRGPQVVTGATIRLN